MNNNILIAQFMGVEHLYEAQSSNMFNQYHEDWNRLMPVVDKCYQYAEVSNPYRQQICASLSGVIDKEDTYQAVVEFIKAHTQTNTHKQTHYENSEQRSGTS